MSDTCDSSNTLCPAHDEDQTQAAPESRSLVFVTAVDLGALNGPTIHVLSVVNELARLGWSLTLLASVPPHGYAIELHPSIEARGLPDMYRVGLPGSSTMLLAAFHFWKLRDKDIIYVRSAPGSAFASLAASLIAPGRSVVEFNGWIAQEAAIVGWPKPLVWLLDWLQSLEARRAARVRTVTAPLAQRAVKAGACPEHVHVVPTGTDIDVFKPLHRNACRAQLGLSGTTHYAAFLGNLWPVVDTDVMLRSVARLRGEGMPIELLVVGDGVARPRLESLTSELGLEASVHRMGSQPPHHANVVLGAADIALAPFVRARNEEIGLSPMKIRDYAAAGKVCVASAFRGITDLANEPWLFLAEPESVASFSAAMSKALAASDDNTVSERARTYAERHFSWQAIVAQIDAILRDVTQRGADR